MCELIISESLDVAEVLLFPLQTALPLNYRQRLSQVNQLNDDMTQLCRDLLFSFSSCFHEKNNSVANF